MVQPSKLFLAAAALAATSLLSGCDGSVRREGRIAPLLEIVRTDAARNRLWVLDQEALTVYDALNGRRLRRVILPDWVLAGPRDGCPPSLALDASGAAFVSSNVVPVLWRVDPQRFRLTRITLELDADADKDVGRIDVGAGRASKVASSPAPGACDPALLRMAARQ